MNVGVQDLRRGVQELRDSTLLSWMARSGLVARTVFYLLLAYLTARVAMYGHTRSQDNAHGALTAVAGNVFGQTAILAAAAGFLAFAVARFVAAYADDDVGVFRRFTSAGQGLFYVGMAWVAASFALGHHSTGSEQQHESTVGKFLALPAGQEIVLAIGFVIVGVSLWQVRVALTGDYNDGWCVERAPTWLQKAIPVIALFGIIARALVFVPVGVLVVVAAVTVDPHRAKGLSSILTSASGTVAGTLGLGLVAFGFTVFAVYSLIESRYRDIESGA